MMYRWSFRFLLVMAVFSSPAVWSAPQSGQIPLPGVERMPNLPQPFEMRDWRQTAKDIDEFVFDFNREGELLPAILWDKSHVNTPEDIFGIRAYIGDFRSDGRAYDIITSMGAVLGATLVGVDKSNQAGRNWVEMCQGYFCSANGENVYLNNVTATTGQTFWYELLPNILFYQIAALYPGVGRMDEQFKMVADRWYEASRAMGGETDPWRLPDFNHTAFSLSTMKPVDNGVWKEADACAAITFLQYMAYLKFNDPKYLTGARWGAGYMDASKENPYYECLLPYGVYAAARMNAEQGGDHDLTKMINWLLDGDNWRKWGTTKDKWGDYDVSGLASSMIPGHGYAFAMNSFISAGMLAPVARYDNRYARAIGKWILNIANAARLFYPNALPANMQTCKAWADANDPKYCLAYEGLRQFVVLNARALNEKTVNGSVVSGTCADTIFRDDKREVLSASSTTGQAGLDHIWEFSVEPGSRHVVVIWGRVESETAPAPAFQFEWAESMDGPWEGMFELTKTEDHHGWKDIKPVSGKVFIRVRSGNAAARLQVDDIYIETHTTRGPYAMGDPLMHGWAKSDLGLYGSVFVGMLGSIVNETNVPGILRLDLTATETLPAKSWPTCLLYNPYAESKTVVLPVGDTPSDIYDAAGNTWKARSVKGDVSMVIPGDNAMVITVYPSDVKLERREGRLLAGDAVIDYSPDADGAS